MKLKILIVCTRTLGTEHFLRLHQNPVMRVGAVALTRNVRLYVSLLSPITLVKTSHDLSVQSKKKSSFCKHDFVKHYYN